MKDTEQLGQALKLLREADADRGPSPFVETRLRAAFREHHSRGARRLGWLWTWVGSALSAAAALGFAAWRLSAPASVEAPKPLATAVQPPVAIVEPAPVPRQLAAKRERPPSVPRRRSAPAPVDAQVVREVQEFIPLPYAPPMSSWDRGQVMRVRVPRHSLRSLGIPVNEERLFERVPADILMGEDGLARGIRLVGAGER
jgi:hypothetical protein